MASLDATIELLSDEPAMARLRDAEAAAAAAAGQVMAAEDMAELMVRRRRLDPPHMA